MSNIVKSKFAGMLRGLLRRFDDNGATNGTTLVAPSRPMAGTTFPRGSSHAGTRQSRPQPDFAPAPAAPAAGPRGLQLPLPSVIAGLPMDLRAKLMQTPPTDAFVSIPVEKVLSQLARGSVKISFGELRGALPGLFVNSGTENDARQIALPLNEIISRINPALLSRRAVKKVELSDDVAGPFGPRVQGVNFTPAQAPTKAATTTTPKAPEPVSTPPTPKSVTPPPTFVPKTMATAPRPARVAPAPVAPAAAVPSAPLKPVFSAPLIPPAPVPFSPAPAAPATGSFNSAPQIPVENPILAPLSALAEKWPDTLKMELVQANLMSAQVALPPSLIEPGLKRGRVRILWKNLRMMIRPKTAPVSVHDGVEVELPLKVLAPLFFASQKAAGLAKQKVSVTAEIPNFFHDSKQAEAALSPMLASAPAPVPIPAPAPPAPAKPADTNYFSKLESPSDTEFRRQASPGTDFMSRGATPGEVVARAMMLPGVVGAVVALYDGLKIASELPSDLNGDTVAAFLPQIFARTGQSTKELRMGGLNNLSFTVGNVPWKIFRVSAVYFAAFGRAGEALPTAPLAELAMQLDRRNK